MDYGELRKRFIPRRMILFAMGKLNRRGRRVRRGHLQRGVEEKVPGARNIRVARWSRVNPRSETLSTIDGLNQADYVFMRRSREGKARKFNNVGYVGRAKIADTRRAV